MVLLGSGGAFEDVGVYANVPVVTGQVLAIVPSHIVLGDDSNAKSDALVSIIRFLREQPDEWMLPVLIPSLCILFAKHYPEENAFWAPYIEFLPKAEAMTSALFFSPAELILLSTSTRAYRLFGLTLQVVDEIHSR
jgi:hypothetical protein